MTKEQKIIRAKVGLLELAIVCGKPMPMTQRKSRSAPAKHPPLRVPTLA